MQRLVLTQNEAAQAGTRYNVPLINSLILYVGMQVYAEQDLFIVQINMQLSRTVDTSPNILWQWLRLVTS